MNKTIISNDKELEDCLENISKQSFGEKSKKEGWYIYYPSKKSIMYNERTLIQDEIIKITLEKNKLNPSKTIDVFYVFDKGIYLTAYLNKFTFKKNFPEIVVNLLNKYEPNSAFIKGNINENKVMYRGKELTARFLPNKGLIVFIYTGMEELLQNNQKTINELINLVEEDINENFSSSK